MLSDNIHLEKDATFLPEIWAWYVIGVVVIFLRYVVRIRTVGWRGLQGDDYMTVLSLALYTMDAVLVHMVYHTGANVDVPPGVVDKLTEEDVRILTYGSKLELAAWYSYTGLIWCMKFTLLFFYQRLTLGTIQNKTITYLFWLCGVTYLAVFCTVTFGCFPTADNWAVRPLPSKACTFKPQNFYVTAILNVITDAIIMVIPIPMLWRLKVSMARKLAIAALLSSGLFVIAAAIIRAVLTLGATPSAVNINRWGVRETIIGLLTVMAPILSPLFRKAFWRSGAYVPDSHGHGSSWNKSHTATGTYGKGGAFELHSTAGKEPSVGIGPSNGSTENIIEKNSSDGENGVVVMVQQTYDIRSHDRDEEASIGNGIWSQNNAMGYNTQVTAQNNNA